MKCNIKEGDIFERRGRAILVTKVRERAGIAQCISFSDHDVEKTQEHLSDLYTYRFVRNIMSLLATALLVLALAGCTVVWTDDAFYCSFLTLRQADAIVYDSNSVTARILNLSANPESIKLVTPYGMAETE